MTGRTRIKICGLTRVEDAQLAVSLGADAVGFVFWPGSPRVVVAEHVPTITASLPAPVTRVGVFVNMPVDDVARIVGVARLDVAQLHGEERVDDYRGVATRLIKGLSLADDTAVVAARAVPADVTPLIDAHDPARRGGTGRRADWTRATMLARERPVMLAGGLTPENVAIAVRAVRPWGVDVSSGVEISPGVKSAEKLRAFFREVAASRPSVNQMASEEQ